MYVELAFGFDWFVHNDKGKSNDALLNHEEALWAQALKNINKWLYSVGHRLNHHNVNTFGWDT